MTGKKRMFRFALEKVVSEDMADIWSLLGPEEKRLIVDNFTIHNYKKNEIVYREGEEPAFVRTLLKGKIKKYKDGVGGRQQIIRLLRPVQYFGYRAHFAGTPYVSSAAAFEQSVIGALPLTIVDDLIERNRQVAWFFIHEMARNLGNSDTRIVNLTQKHIRGRLAEALMLLREHYGYEDDEATLRIYMGREDLASLSNMTTSNAIRTLAAFVDEGLLVVDGRKIKIIDESSLKKISRFG